MDFRNLIAHSLKSKLNEELLGVELNEDTLKLVHVHATNLKREVVNVFSQEIRSMSDKEIAALIQKTLNRQGLKEVKAFLAAPLYSAITRNIEIPSRDPKEIREIIHLQASRHTPYSRSEIIIDMLDLGPVRENYTRVLLVIIPKEEVARQIKILEVAGLKLEKVFFPAEGICEASAGIVDQADRDSVHVIVSVDSHFTSFIVTQKRKLLFVRGIPIGTSHFLREKPVYFARFAEELQKSLETYINDDIGARPSHLVLTGATEETNGLQDVIEAALHVPVKCLAYLDDYAVSTGARVVASSFKVLSFFNLILPLLFFDRMKINLAPEESKKKILREHRAKELKKMAALTVILLCVVIVSFVSRAYLRTAYLDHLRQRYQPIKEAARQLEQLFGNTQAVKQYLATRGSSLESLMEIYDALPADVWLADIQYDQGLNFTIKGVSNTRTSVFSFVSNLEKSKLLKNVKTKYVNTRNEEGKEVADFEINCSFEGPRVR